MQVSKWGNSLAIRLPAAVVKALNLEEGDDIEVTITGERSVKVARTPSVGERLRALRRFRGSLPKGFKFDRDEANER